MPATFSIETLPQLDDRDITFLYEVVSTAQHSKQRPIKALFTAYEDILNQHGSDTEHDSKCFRFLSHAGSELAKDGTEGLVGRFRDILSQAGIQLVLEDGDNGSEISHRDRRRASFNDSNLDATWASRASQSEPFDLPRSQQQRASSHGDRVGRIQQRSSAAARSASAARSEKPDSVAEDFAPVLAWTSRSDKIRLSKEADHFLSETLGRKYLWTWQARTTRARRRQEDLLHMAFNHDKKTLLKQSLGQMRDALFDSRFWQQQERRAGRARDLFLLTKAFTHWAQTASDEVLRTNIARRHILRTRYFNAWRDISAVNEIKCRRVALQKWFSKWKSRSITHQRHIFQASEVRTTSLMQRIYWQWFWAFCDRKAPVWKDIRLKASKMDTMKVRLLNSQEMKLAAAGQHNFLLQKRSLANLWHRFQNSQSDEMAALRVRRRNLLLKTLDTLRRKTRLRPREIKFVVDYDLRILSKAFVAWRATTQMYRQADMVNIRRLQGHALTSWNDRLREQTLRIKIDDRLTVQALYRWVLLQRLALFNRVVNHRQKQAVFHRFREQVDTRHFQLQEATELLHVNQDRRLLRAKASLLYQQVRTREQQGLMAVELCNSRALQQTFAIWKQKSSETRRLSRWASQARFYCLAHSTIKRWRDATTESQRRRRREAYAIVRQRHKLNLARQSLHILNVRRAQCRELKEHSRNVFAEKDRMITRYYFEIWATKSDHWHGHNITAQEFVSERRRGFAFAALVSRYAEVSAQQARAASFARDGSERTASRSFRRLGDVVFSLRRHVDTAEAWQVRKFSQHRQDMLRYWALKANELRAARIAEDPDSPSQTPGMRASRLRQRLVAETSVSHVGDEALAKVPYSSTRAQPQRSLLMKRPNPDHSELDFTTTSVPGYLRTPSRKAARNKVRFKTIAARSIDPRSAYESSLIDFGSSVLASTTPAPLAAGSLGNMETLTPQITPFQRKLRAGGYPQASTTPLSTGRYTPYVGASELLLRGAAETPYGGTGKSVGNSGRSIPGADNDSGDEEGYTSSPARSAR